LRPFRSSADRSGLPVPTGAAGLATISAEGEGGLPGPRPGEPVPPPPGERQRSFRALRHREFRQLWIAYAVGDIGFWISFISLQWQMSRTTDSNAGWLGLLFFTNFVPMLVLAPLAGVAADRFDRKSLLVASRAAITVVATVLAVLTGAHMAGPGVLLAFAAVFGSVFAVMAPAGQAVIANAVPVADLASAVSLQSAGTNVSRITGPALAAPILALWGAGAAFAVYAASNVVMAVVLVRIRLTARIIPPTTANVWRQFADGLAHARERRAFPALAMMSVFSVFGAAHVVMFPVIAHEVLGRGETSFTTLVSASGVGAVIGALTTGARRSGPSLVAGARHLAAFSVVLVLFALSRSWPLSVALAGVLGIFYFATTTTLNTLLQHLADDDKRGRIMSLFTLTWAGLVPFGGLWMGGVAGGAGAPTALVIGALVCCAYAVFVMATSRRLDRPTRPVRQPATIS
jgi:MFS family permease